MRFACGPGISIAVEGFAPSRHNLLRKCLRLLVLTALVASPTIAFSQNSAAPAIAEKPPTPTVRVTNTLHVTVDQGRVSTDAKIEYHVLDGEVKSLQFAVPLGQRILDVFTPDVVAGDWAVAKESNRQLVTVPLKSAAKNTIIVEVRTDASLEGAEATVAGIDDAAVVRGIHAVDVQSERGLIVVAPGASSALSIQNAADLVAVNESEVPAESRRVGADYFRYINTKFTLKVAVRPAEPRMTVEQLTQLGFIGYDLRLHSELKYQVDRPGVSKFAIKLPENLEIDSVGADAIEDFRIDSENNVLTVNLKQVLHGPVGVSIFSRRLLKPDDFREAMPLPMLQPMNVIRESGEVSLFAAPGIVVIPDDDERVGMVPTAVAGQPLLAGMHAVAGWKYARRPIDVPARVVRKPARVTATIGTLLKVHAQRVEVNAKIVYELADVACSKFRVSLPEAATEGARIQIGGKSHTAEVVEARRAEQAADGWVTWTVVTSQPVSGQLPLDISYEQPLVNGTKPDAKNGIGMPQAEGCEIENAEGEAVTALPETIAGEVNVESADGVSLFAVPSANQAQAIAPAQSSLAPSRGELAYRYSSQPCNMTISTHPRAAAAESTIVPRAAVEVGVGNHEKIVWRCRYQVMTKERQQLAIDLPGGSSSISAFVDGSPTTLMKAADFQGEDDTERYHANIVRARDSEKPLVLTLSFASPIPARAFESRGGRLYIPVPQIVDGNDAATIRQLRTKVWIPDDYALIGAPQYFVHDGQWTDLDEWIGGSTPVAGEFPVSGHVYSYRSLGSTRSLEFTWWDMPFYTRVLSGALIVIALVLCATSWRNRLALVAVCGLAFLAYAVTNPETARHALIAARFGLVGIVAVWAVPSVYRAGQRNVRPAESTATTERIAPMNPPPR